MQTVRYQQNSSNIQNQDQFTHLNKNKNYATNNINNSGNSGKRLTIDMIINYIATMRQTQEKLQHIENIVRQEDYKLLYFGKSKDLTNLPNNLGKIFEGISTSTVRTGIITKPLSPDQTNFTFFMSLLFCIDPNFSNAPIDAREKQASELKSNLIYNMKHSKLFESFKYKELKWKKKTIIDDITCGNTDSKLVARYVTDYFNINLFIIDINNDSIIACYPEELFDPFKNTIIMSLFDCVYEPVYDITTSRIWKYTCNNYKTLLDNIKNDANKLSVNIMDFNPKNKEQKNFIMQPTPIDILKKYSANLPLGTKYFLCIQDKNKSETTIQTTTETTTTETITETTTTQLETITEQTPIINNYNRNQYEEILCSETNIEFCVNNLNSDMSDSDISTSKKNLPFIKHDFENNCSNDNINSANNTNDNNTNHITTNDNTTNDNNNNVNVNIDNNQTYNLDIGKFKMLTIGALKKMKLNELLKEVERINIVPVSKNGKYKTKSELLIEINDYYKRCQNTGQQTVIDL
mgnify:CR=1 FL=1